MTGSAGRIVDAHVAAPLRHHEHRRAALVMVMLLALTASAACHKSVPGVLPASIGGNRVHAIELKDGRVVTFDGAGAHVYDDSVVGPVAGVRTATALPEVRRADIVTLDQARTGILAGVLAIAAAAALIAIAIAASGGLSFGTGGYPGGGV